MSCVVGKYLYENLDKINEILSNEFQWSVNWTNSYHMYDNNADYIQLIPVTIYNEKEVLGQAWMDENAILVTLKDKRLCLYSRSRCETWYKGDTSGNFIPMDEISLDYDCDSISSYTCKLYKAGLEKILKKFGEEAFELALAKTKEERLLEMCDVLYYLLVIASYDDIKMEDIFIEMENRRKK